MLNRSEWFSEVNNNTGLAFSLKIKEKCAEINSPFQKIEIYDTEKFGKLMVIDGYIMLSSADHFFYHEMMVHPALLTHPCPENVVIIGGGDCGSLREVLKHPIKNVTQIEIDQAVTHLAEQYFPELCQSNNDKRAHLIFDDGLAWMKNAPAGSVDIIIVDSSEPEGPSEGLFNQAFYQQCYQALSPKGILVHQSESPIINKDIIAKMRRAMLEAGFCKTLTMPFPQPVYPSGLWSATMASKNLSFAQFRQDVPLIRQLQTQYYHPALHQSLLRPIALLK